LRDFRLPNDQINASLKWLQYYLDFCSRYQHPAAAAASLPLFLNKLEEKKQSAVQRGAAEKAVSLFLQLIAERKQTAARTAESTSAADSIQPASELKTSQGKSACWVDAFKGPAEEIKLRHLACREKKVSASTQNQAFNALLFFYRPVLKKEYNDFSGIPRAKKTQYVPAVLSRKEIDAIIKNLLYPYDLLVKLLYSCGLRLNEVLNLRVRDFDFEEGIVTIFGKGRKFRKVLLPKKILNELAAHLGRLEKLYQRDLETGYDIHAIQIFQSLSPYYSRWNRLNRKVSIEPFHSCELSPIKADRSQRISVAICGALMCIMLSVVCICPPLNRYPNRDMIFCRLGCAAMWVICRIWLGKKCRFARGISDSP